MSGTLRTQESLIANFLFDGDGSDELISAFHVSVGNRVQTKVATGGHRARNQDVYWW